MKVVRKRTLKLRHARIATAPAVSVLAIQAALCSLCAQESCTRRAGGLARGSAWDTATCIGAQLSPALLPTGHRETPLVVSLESPQPLWQVPGSHAVPWAAPSRAGDEEMATSIKWVVGNSGAPSQCAPEGTLSRQ